jgi:hypothetical protein
VPPIPSGPSYVILISYPKVLAVPPIPQGALIHDIYFIPEGIGGAANILEAPHIYLYFHTQGVLAVGFRGFGV